MNFKKLFIVTCLNLSLFSVAANANPIFQAESKTGQGYCQNLSGPWSGGGTLTAKVLGVDVRCDYAGRATVVEPSPYNYSVDVVFDLQSGSKVCPGRQAYV